MNTPSCPVWPMTRGSDCPFDPPAEALEIQSESPAARVAIWDGSTPWLLTRHADVKALLRNPTVSADASKPGFPQPSEKAAAGRAKQLQFQRMDPPVHDDHRAMLASWFSVAAVQRFAPSIETSVASLLDEMAAAGAEGDLVRAFSTMVPAMVTCELLDLPVEHAEYFDERINTWTSLASSMEESAQAAEDVLQYFDDLIGQRLDSQADDLVSRLIREQLIPGHLTRLELQHMLHLLVIGGFDTTANMLTLGVVVLLSHPEQLAQLRADESLWPSAIEELLRYLSVTQHVAYRMAREDIEIAGVTIAAGEGVIAPVNLANRDPEVYEDPHRFDIHRNPRNHLAFGFGVHQCLGQQLARLELKIAFPALFDRFPDLRIEQEPQTADYKDSLVYGLQQLQVSWGKSTSSSEGQSA